MSAEPGKPKIVDITPEVVAWQKRNGMVGFRRAIVGGGVLINSAAIVIFKDGKFQIIS